MNINLHIERLILDGLPSDRRQGEYLQTAVEQELSRLLTEGGVLTQFNTGGVLASVSGGSIQLATRSDPAGLGEQIAAAVYRGFGSQQ